APEVVSLADGGGAVSAARRPIRGAEKVARFLVGLAAQPLPGALTGAAEFNGLPAVVVRGPDGVDSVVLVEVSEVDGADLVTAVYAVRNPEKLAHL
ncbi:RNA polymerase subunit sigma-24, partial [Pseudonocardia sp. McavD-2-B]|nr:RNA polymerase subunit sigma-24 [Pseudonocardia sp. McavD-2-B]